MGPDFKTLTAGAIWDDLKIGLRHPFSWSKCAIVTDVNWIKKTVRLLGFLWPVEMVIFDNDRLIWEQLGSLHIEQVPSVYHDMFRRLLRNQFCD